MQKKIIAVTKVVSLQELDKAYAQFETDLKHCIDPRITPKIKSLLGKKDNPVYTEILAKIHEALNAAKLSGELNLDHCSLVKLPESFSGLTNLRTLSLTHNLLVEIPGIEFKPPLLEDINLSYNKLVAFPPGYHTFIDYPVVNFLILDHNPITVITDYSREGMILNFNSPIQFQELQHMYPDPAKAPSGIRSLLESVETTNGCRINTKTQKSYAPCTASLLSQAPYFKETDLVPPAPAKPANQDPTVIMRKKKESHIQKPKSTASQGLEALLLNLETKPHVDQIHNSDDSSRSGSGSYLSLDGSEC